MNERNTDVAIAVMLVLGAILIGFGIFSAGGM